MFGRSNDDQNGQANAPDPGLTAPVVGSQPTDNAVTAPVDNPGGYDPLPVSSPPAETTMGTPAITLPSTQSVSPDDPAPVASTNDLPDLTTQATSVAAPATTSSSAGSPSTDDLLTMKQQALQHLQPLVGHLDQSPEEEFRTLMMMIQASDDQALLNQAYEAAQKITDDKARAQALLDVINEINYFTQHHS